MPLRRRGSPESAGRRANWPRWLGPVAAALGLACGGASSADSPEGEHRAPTPAPEAPRDPSLAAESGVTGDAADGPAAGTPSERLLRWLDPEAVGVTWVGGVHDLDADALVAVFAVPPRAARMLRDLELAQEGLDLLLGADKAGAWLRPEAMAMLPAVAHGTYIVRLLGEVPAGALTAALEAAEMEPTTVEGFTLWEPSGAFPWRILFADAGTLAMIPRQEMGSGIGPLTAARDLPASPLEGEVSKAIREDPEILVDLFASGPLLHMDLSDDVGVFRLNLRRWQSAGLDANVLLQPLGDPAAAADELEARRAPLESDAIQDLIERVAYSAEPPVVLGRLQIVAEDRGRLRRP